MDDLQPPPTVGSADYQLPAPTDKDEPMTDENPDGVSAGPYGGDERPEPNAADPTPIRDNLRFADPERPDTLLNFDESGQVREESAVSRSGVTDSGVHHWREGPPPTEPMQFAEPALQDSQPLTPEAYANADRADCPHCHGTGKILTTADLLRESIGLLGNDPRELDNFVAEFYRRLLDAAPDLAPLFPEDLTRTGTGSDPNGRGKAQRDKLLHALIALATSYDPDDTEKMKVLDTHLAAFGRSHASFPRADGSGLGATLDEYHAVKVTLFGLLHDAAGERWLPEYDDVWSEAYDYAAAAMMFAGQRHALGRQLFPRTTRR
jgi:hemoglobin-like flavoprotein